jgi:hypothetical protein
MAADDNDYAPIFTVSMSVALDKIAKRGGGVRVVGVRYGLPVLRYRSGVEALLMTSGRVERLPCSLTGDPRETVERTP